MRSSCKLRRVEGRQRDSNAPHATHHTPRHAQQSNPQLTF
ncbi:hypothetical protein HMPREF1586_00587 [Gardnerella vaginalis JCP8522]|nr:hypothetical protein HMPREF1586_00587 [Gardnerella vaginalis JCP8522]